MRTPPEQLEGDAALALSLALTALVVELRDELRDELDPAEDAIAEPGTTAEAEVLAFVRGAMPRLLEVDDPDHPDHPDQPDQPDSLSRADLYRIRAAKLVARLLPPGSLADRGRRRRLRARVRELIALHLGAPLRPSVYLDPQAS